MANYYSDNEDLKFYLEKWIDWSALVKLTEDDLGASDSFASVEEAVAFYHETVHLVGEFAGNEIAPRARAIDEAGLSFEDGEVQFPKPLSEIFSGINNLELHGMALPRELGGMNCPLALYMINGELLSRADVSVMTHHSFHGGMAMAMLVYSIVEGSTTFEGETSKIKKTRFERAIREIARGEAWGSMDITEPDAGSDMAMLRSKAVQDESGQWLLTGQKIFITSGHAKYHFVVARTEDVKKNDEFKGLDGLSLFLVQTYEVNENGEKKWIAQINGIEKKIGHHGSATVSISFDACPAELIGRRGEGFKQMLLIMNGARIGVGFEALGLCEAAYRLAKDFAANRPSMGKTIDQHELIADYLDEMRTDIQGIRALAIDCAFHEEMAQKNRIRAATAGSEMEKKEAHGAYLNHQKQSRLLTPLLKYFAAEKAVDMGRKCIQIHGGVGYTKEYDAERLLRDALVFPIYEGTSQIQSLMAMKDNMSAIIKDPQDFARQVALARTRSLTSLNPLERRVAKLQNTAYSVTTHLLTKVVYGKVKSVRPTHFNQWIGELLKNWDPKRDFAPALLHAERFTQILIDKAICENLLAQAKKYPEREELLSRYLERAEPRSKYLQNMIVKTGSRLLEQLQSQSVDSTSAMA